MYRAIPTDRSHPDYLLYRRGIGSGIELGTCLVGGYGLAKGGLKAATLGYNAWKLKRGTFVAGKKLAGISPQIAKTATSISRFPSPSNPLQGTRYSRKVLLQMEYNWKTGQPDFHGFPKVVDNYANLGRRELIKGKDGINRIKITLDGGYKGLDGHFEWIIEADKLVNHRLFIPNH